MSEHQLTIHFDPRPPATDAAAPLTGRVTVTAAADTTCRKIVLHWACRDDRTFHELASARLELAVDVDWRAGQTYRYPFEFQPSSVGLHDAAGRWYVRPGLHLAALSRPDNAYEWQPAGDIPAAFSPGSGQPKVEIDPVQPVERANHPSDAPSLRGQATGRIKGCLSSLLTFAGLVTLVFIGMYVLFSQKLIGAEMLCYGTVVIAIVILAALVILPRIWPAFRPSGRTPKDAAAEPAVIRDVAASPLAIAPAPLAPLLKRVGAMLIDGIILVMLIVAASFLSSLLVLGLTRNPLLPTLLSLLLFVAVPEAYFFLAYATGGQTPGKWLLNIEVVAADGSSLNWRKGAARAYGLLVSFFFFFPVGFLTALWDKDNQTWSDKLAGTVVVEKSPEPFGPRISTEESGRRQRRYWLTTGLPAFVLFALIAACVSTVRFSKPSISPQVTGELARWPDQSHVPQDLLPEDLSQIGLGPAALQVASARGTLFSRLSFSQGTFAKYEAGQDVAAMIAVLKYGSQSAAAADFENIVAWAEDYTCGQYRWVIDSETGYLECLFASESNTFYQSGPWIVLIQANEYAPAPHLEFVDQLRVALFAHWETLD